MTESTVWVIERGSYQERMIWGVASSVDVAARLVRDTYGDPYIVRWEEPIPDEGGAWSMTGHFERVDGHCGAGPSTFDFTPYQLDVLWSAEENV